MLNIDKDFDKKQLLAYANDLAGMYKAEKQNREQMEITSKKLRSIIDNVTEGLASLDNDMIITEANQAFSKSFGIPIEELLNQPLKTILAEDGWDELFQDIDNINQADEIIINPDKKRQRYYRVTRGPIIGAGDKRKGWIFSFRDITERKRSDLMKDEFFNLISHEIQTPLNAIKGAVSILRNLLSEKELEDDSQLLLMIQNASDRLIRTVEEMRDVAQLALEIPENRHEFDLRSAVNEALEEIDFKLRKRSIIVQREIPDSPCNVYGYQSLVVKAIQHSLENAVEFSSFFSKITISLEDSGKMWSLGIRDYGEGIPPEYQERVFDRFYKAPGYIDRSHEGLGLGLPIVKRTVLLHRGEVLIESKLGEGTKITLQLPKYEEEVIETINELSQLKQEISRMHTQNLQYAKDLADTFIAKKELSWKLEKTHHQMLRSDKLAGMGEMAAGIAHEVNNLIAPALGNTQMLLMDKDKLDPELYNKIQVINDYGWKAVKMLQQVLHFTRKDEKDFEKVELISLINKILNLHEYQFRKCNIEVVREFDKKVVGLTGNPGQLEQVFNNLIGNAVDTMEDGGRLTIGVTIKEETQDNKPVSWAEICITDTGKGIEKEIRDSIFEPFFTTKKEGEGTGLGLFICHQLIESHGGIIDLKSKVGEGATFIVKLRLSK